MAGEVDLDPAEVDERRRVASSAACSARRKIARIRAVELAQAERLGDVVVGAELEADHLVDLGVLGREHDDRHAGLGPDDPAHLDARQLRQHQVEQDEVRPLGAEQRERLAAVGGGDGPVPLELERLDQGLAERGLVVHDEDRAGHARRIVPGGINAVFTAGRCDGRC